MNRTLRLFAFVAAFATPAMLSAQGTSDKPLSVGVSGGLSLPMGDFGDGVDAGFDVAGHVYLKPAALKAFGLRGDVSFDKWNAKASSSVSMRSLGLVGNAVIDVSTSGMMKPYVLGGIGLFNSKSTYKLGATQGSSEGNTDLGIQVGGGLKFQLSGFSTFLEAKFVNVFSEGSSTNWLPITFGIRF